MPDTGFSPDADFPVINCEKGIATITFEKNYSGNVEISGGTRPNVVPNVCTARIPDTADNLTIIEKSGLEYEIKDGRIVVTAHGKAAHAATPALGDNAIVKLLKALSDIDVDLKRFTMRLKPMTEKARALTFATTFRARSQSTSA